MTTDNLGAVLYGKNDIRIEQVSMPGEPKPHEVILRMSQVGICGTDKSFFTNGAIGPCMVKEPVIQGHESSGVVFKVGSDVKHLKIGDRVSIQPFVPCRMCEYCKGGRYNICSEVSLCQTPPSGNLCQFITHAGDFCYKLPEHVSMEEGALVEPLSVAVYACRRAGVTLGSTVLICGAGPIGLLCLLTAKAMGATNICITDVVDNRLNLAKKLGADHTLLIGSDDVKQIAQTVSEMIGSMPNITIECSGAESSIQLGIIATKSGGVILLVGLGPAEVKIPLLYALVREVDIRGIFCYANCHSLALEMVASGKVNLKPLITHRFKLEETFQAFETAHKKAGGAIKVMISCE